MRTDPLTVTVTRREFEELEARVSGLETFAATVAEQNRRMALMIAALHHGGNLPGMTTLSEQQSSQAHPAAPVDQNTDTVTGRFDRIEMDDTTVAVVASKKSRARFVPGTGWVKIN